MAAFLGFHESGFWLVISLLCSVAVWAGYHFVPLRWRPWLIAANWTIIPYLALIAGGASPRLVGLTVLDWPASFRLGVSLALAVLALATAGRMMIGGRRPLPAQSGGENVAAEKVRRAAPLVAVAFCGAEEFYWCFWRGALWETLLALPIPLDLPAYWATWLAALIALPGILIIHATGALRMTKIAILVVTSIVYFYTLNFWLCWFLHAAIWIILATEIQEEGHDTAVA